MKTKALIKNLEIKEPNLIYSEKLPHGTQEFLIKVRERNGLVQVAFESSLGVTYANLGDGYEEYHEEEAKGGSLYFRAEKGGQMVEIAQWI